MSWTLYRWIWQLRSPLCVGHIPAGSLNRTRLYIPGRTIWAALTAEIARQRANNAFPQYEAIGRDLQENARFTYLFPAERVNGRWHAWLPRYEKGVGLCWHREDGKDLPDRQFRQRVLHTHPGTAISPGSYTAEEGTFREVEYVTPYWKPIQKQSHTSPSPMAFVGYHFLKNTLHQEMGEALMNVREVFIGGDTRYGFGHMVLIPCSDQHPWEEAEQCFGNNVNLDGEQPAIQVPSRLLAHGVMTSKETKGNREILFRWHWQRPKQDHQHTLYWVPGTQISSSNQQPTFYIENDGLWHEARRVR